MNHRYDVRDDEGSGTVAAVGLVAVLLVLAAGFGQLIGVIRARQSAVAAADLASLAAAQAMIERDIVVDVASGRCPDVATEAADEVATANRAALTNCSIRPDGTVVVRTEVPVPGPLAGLGPASGSARAGAG